MRLLLTLLITLITGNIYAQYRFIEPNISFSYDNSLLNVKDSSANAVHGTESYGFTLHQPNRMRSYMQVSADIAVIPPVQASSDSLYKALVNQINRYAGDSIIVQTKKFISYKGFTGLGYIALHKKQATYSVAFSGAKFLEDGTCKVYYMSMDKKPITSLDDDYVKFTALLDGIQTYSKKDIQKEALEYTVVVDSVSISMPDVTYTGMVRVKEKMNHPVHSVRMDYQSYFPDYRGHVIIFCHDADKGKIEKKGELIVLNEIGKKVAIPFSFTYYNK